MSMDSPPKHMQILQNQWTAEGFYTTRGTCYDYFIRFDHKVVRGTKNLSQYSPASQRITN